MRTLYAWLIGLHPRPFRERFGEEMTAIFDEAAQEGRHASLLADALVSLIRQRWLRPQPRAYAVADSTGHPAAGPAFAMIEDALPRRGALINGAVVTFVLIALMVFGIGRNTSFPRMLIGARYPRPHVLPVERASVSESTATTEVMVPRPAEDPLYTLAGSYFAIIRVLAVLDTDHDRILSAAEIRGAPNTLPRLDLDRNGNLEAEECGFSWGESRPQPQAAQRARLTFMHFHPVLNALDADHDGVISAPEIIRSAEAIEALDRNRDGALHASEVMPGAADNGAALILSRLDGNGDGEVSAEERRGAPRQLGELLVQADRNHDGFTTNSELAAEMRLGAEGGRQLKRAMRSGR